MNTYLTVKWLHVLSSTSFMVALPADAIDRLAASARIEFSHVFAVQRSLRHRHGHGNCIARLCDAAAVAGTTRTCRILYRRGFARPSGIPASPVRPGYQEHGGPRLSRLSRDHGKTLKFVAWRCSRATAQQPLRAGYQADFCTSSLAGSSRMPSSRPSSSCMASIKGAIRGKVRLNVVPPPSWLLDTAI